MHPPHLLHTLHITYNCQAVEMVDARLSRTDHTGHLYMAPSVNISGYNSVNSGGPNIYFLNIIPNNFMARIGHKFGVIEALN